MSTYQIENKSFLARPWWFDLRLGLLCTALLLLLSSFLLPMTRKPSKGFDLLVVVDITGSMNTRDYMDTDKPVSRLETIKARLRAMLPHLPCPARIGLAIFTERQPFLLFEPINVCSAFEPVDQAIAGLDWRMAWEGDSHIASGLYHAIDMAEAMHAHLLFATDGQEAPPLPYSGGPAFQGESGKVRGLILGVGDYVLSPIPKFDDNGREIGFYKMEDVEQENRSGLPPPGAELREGYQARNAPFGAAAATGNEHLSSLHENYLRELAGKTGLAYSHLTTAGGLTEAVLDAVHLRPDENTQDYSPFVLGFALLCMIAVYGLLPLLESVRSMSQKFAPSTRMGGFFQ